MTLRSLLAVPLCMALMLLALVSVANAAGWRVEQMSGKVYVRQGSVQLASLSKDRVLNSGSIVVTDRNGRAKLVRGQQTMIVSPNSIVKLPGGNGRVTKILESIGKVEYDVDRRQVQHFSVETPYLAAVVKGTRFRVDVRKGGASVSVLRGRVEVTNLRSGEHVDVLAGQIAYVNSAKGITVKGVGDIQPVLPGPVREAMVDSVTGNAVDAALGGVSASVGTKGVSASVGSSVSASVGTDGVSANVGSVGASVGSSGVSANVGSGVSANAGSGGVSAGVGGVSVGVGGGGGVSVGLGGLGR